MATVVLDTNVISDLARNDAVVSAAFRAWLGAGNGVVISRVAVYEFRRGVYCGSIGALEAQAGELFLVNFAVIETDEYVWDLAAEIWAALALTGKTRRMDGDILIAATALRGGYEIATRNRDDFVRIANIRPTLLLNFW